MEAFNESLSFDRRFSQVDARGSQAYARALTRAGILTEAERDAIVGGLDQVSAEWSNGEFKTVSSDEDIHTANERRLGEIIGAAAGKLHTGRSRNDQVATDCRMWLREQCAELKGDIVDLVSVTTQRARDEVDILMPGFTHLQPAQPVRWSHWLMMNAWRWQRDAQRLDDALKRINRMPLGSGALAGHPFGLDRVALAQDLGFSSPTDNSLDSVSDRDFVAEFLFVGSLLGVHLSALAEDLIIYSSAQFKFVGLSDAYATGSSLMPQKKNPDALELLRGKAGRNVGGLVTLLTALKGLPSTYNKDMQEDKEPLFDCADTLSGCVKIATGVVTTMTPNAGRMRDALEAEMLATDLADYLVRRGVPFRETHHIAGRAVALAEDKGCRLTDLTLVDLQPLCKSFEADVVGVWDMEASVESRDSVGGTSRRAVLEQVDAMQAWIDKNRS